MAKLTLVESKKPTARADMAHRAAPTEGDAAKELMIANGYQLRRESKTQYEFDCPFHEEPGASKKKSTNFYINKLDSKYKCQAASCGEKGNLITLERHFGIVVAGDSDTGFVSREARVQTWQAALTTERRKVFYDHGLNDTTIERFRLGFDKDCEIGTGDKKFKVEGGAYVIPYLEGRHVVGLRYYSPDCKGPHGAKYFYEPGTESRMFNANASCGDPTDGIVFVCEGEQKAMILEQLGYAAVAVPGASNFKREWVGDFIHAKQIKICFDNDSPEHHRYDQHKDTCPEGCTEKHICRKCGEDNPCQGHNPGQDGAFRTLEMLGWKAKNVVLPRPDGVKKTDINDYFTRDHHSAAEFAELALNRKSTFLVQSFDEIMLNPPEETSWFVENLLPAAGRLLVTGAPKVGKSLWAENLALSIATGIPFLHRFPVDHPMRVLLLDRELSRRSFYDRITAFVKDRPGYEAGLRNLLPEHDHNIKLDRPGALEVLTQLVEMNGAEVIMFDTAYKFFSSDMESSSNVMKALDVLDQLIQATGVSVVLTHHHRKGNGKQAEAPNPDQVVGSFLWTGWPNGTVLLNFAKDRVREPFTTICSFAAFRDCAQPDPLVLHRTRESIGYTAISNYVPDDESPGDGTYSSDELTKDAVAAALVENAPILESDFIDLISTFFRRQPKTVKTILIDLLDTTDNFVRIGRGTSESPYVLKLNTIEEESWDSEHGSGNTPPMNQLTLLEGGAS